MHQNVTRPTGLIQLAAGLILRGTAFLFLALVLAEHKVLAQDNKKPASVRLLLEDAVGQTLVQAAMIYDESSAEQKEPIAKTTSADKPISVAPGRYWIVSVADDSHRELVTVAEGESKDVKIKVERGLWLSFFNAEGKAPERVLVVLRPRVELERWLYWSGLAQGGEELAARRPEATEEELAAARKVALTAPVLREKPEAPSEMKENDQANWYRRRNLELITAQRILSLTGQLEDVDVLLKLAAKTPAAQRAEHAFLIGLIEARHDVLEKGKLSALARGDDAAWALAATHALRRLGLPVGDDLLRRSVIPQEDVTPAMSASHWLRTDSTPATLQTMRKFLQAGVEDFEKGRRYSWALISACLHLLTYGNTEDWKLVASLPFGKLEAGSLTGIAQNPRPLINTALGYMSLLSISDALQGMRDRPADEFQSLREWLNEAFAQAAQKNGGDYYNILNTTLLVESDLFPDADAVRFYYGFAGKERISQYLHTSGEVAPKLSWFAYPDFVDLFVKEWLGGETRYLPQLEYIDLAKIEDAVKRLGKDRAPPGYELYRAYRRIAHRQRAVYDPLPMGQRRWPYVVAYRERDKSGEKFGGGISGVASLKAEWRDKTLVLRLKLDQRAHYEQAGNMLGIGNRGKRDEWPHHRYMIDHGRNLIESVVVRRGSRRFIAKDTERVEDNWLLFEAELDNSSLADLWVDVNLKFIDQPITLTESLFAGNIANQIRNTRFRNSKATEKSSTGDKL